MQQAPAGPGLSVGQIERDRRVPGADQTLGNFPSLPPAGRLLAAVFPPNPFTPHPRAVIGHRNPSGVTFRQVRANSARFSCFAPNCRGVLTTTASSARDASRGQDEIKANLPLGEGPIQPLPTPHPNSRGVRQLLQDILRPRPDPGNNVRGMPRPPASGRGERCRTVPSRLAPLIPGSCPRVRWGLSPCHRRCSSSSIRISIQRDASHFSEQRLLSLPPLCQKNPTKPTCN